MRNNELFDPSCPDDRVKKLVKVYTMRGLVDNRGSYSPEKLLARQGLVYQEWMAEVRKHRPSFDCGFYEWLNRGCDAAFIFEPGDLVKYDGHYCVVVQRCPTGISWVYRWRLRNGMTVQDTWPQEVNAVKLKDPYDREYIVNALAEAIEPADIPSEVFALACRKAKDCPMMKGD